VTSPVYKLSAGFGIEVVVSMSVRPIRTVKSETPTTESPKSDRVAIPELIDPRFRGDDLDSLRFLSLTFIEPPGAHMVSIKIEIESNF
jgi:hypothetical protein